jgi:HPt (histidine-containing phosphotransfer) domain-containing protein
MFFNDSPKHFGNISAALDRGDAHALEAAAHRYLSSIENLGVLRMRKHCMELEALGRAGTIKGAAKSLAALRREFDIARQHLAAIAPVA